MGRIRRVWDYYAGERKNPGICDWVGLDWIAWDEENVVNREERSPLSFDGDVDVS